MSAQAQTGEGPWNPGLQSQIPAAYRPLTSMLRPESIANDLREIDELEKFSGLPIDQLVEFKAERLIIHEALIRMTADVEVADGPNYEDLGFTFRKMVHRVLTGHLSHQQERCAALLVGLKKDAKARVIAILSGPFENARSHVPEGPPWRAHLAGLFRRPFRSQVHPPRSQGHALASEPMERLEVWKQASRETSDDLERACLSALITVASAICGRFGRIVGEANLIAELAARIVCNTYGSARIGAEIADDFREGVRREEYRLLPPQQRPFIMNIKGASASGKSSMRPLQKELARRLEIPWSDFSVISPDIWRKYLLDYATLGEAFKYAGALTAQELEIVDAKLDRYIADKNAQGRLTHLLIDRFRFDSFLPEAEVDVNSRLLTRFGSRVFLHFMITPPEATVERAWWRGLQVGRYKAVDDLLAHNIEAFGGMPEIFFTWALFRKKQVHYEFLDNDVPYGTAPSTVAFGRNGELNILDVAGLLNIERYKLININARSPDSVYVEQAQGVKAISAFLRRCVLLLPIVSFANRKTGLIYAQFSQGKLTALDGTELSKAIPSGEARDALDGIIGSAGASTPSCQGLPRLDPREAHTIGRWG